jgi:hypothetical protein
MIEICQQEIIEREGYAGNVSFGEGISRVVKNQQTIMSALYLILEDMKEKHNDDTGKSEANKKE